MSTMPLADVTNSGHVATVSTPQQEQPTQQKSMLPQDDESVNFQGESASTGRTLFTVQHFNSPEEQSMTEQGSRSDSDEASAEGTSDCSVSLSPTANNKQVESPKVTSIENATQSKANSGSDNNISMTRVEHGLKPVAKTNTLDCLTHSSAIEKPDVHKTHLNNLNHPAKLPTLRSTKEYSLLGNNATTKEEDRQQISVPHHANTTQTTTTSKPTSKKFDSLTNGTTLQGGSTTGQSLSVTPNNEEKVLNNENSNIRTPVLRRTRSAGCETLPVHSRELRNSDENNLSNLTPSTSRLLAALSLLPSGPSRKWTSPLPSNKTPVERVKSLTPASPGISDIPQVDELENRNKKFNGTRNEASRTMRDSSTSSESYSDTDDALPSPPPVVQEATTVSSSDQVPLTSLRKLQLPSLPIARQRPQVSQSTVVTSDAAQTNQCSKSAENRGGTTPRIIVARPRLNATSSGKPCLRMRASSDPGTTRERRKKVRFASSLSNARRFSSTAPVRPPVGWSVLHELPNESFMDILQDPSSWPQRGQRQCSLLLQDKRALIQWILLMALWVVAIVDPELVIRVPQHAVRTVFPFENNNSGSVISDGGQISSSEFQSLGSRNVLESSETGLERKSESEAKPQVVARTPCTIKNEFGSSAAGSGTNQLNDVGELPISKSPQHDVEDANVANADLVTNDEVSLKQIAPKSTDKQEIESSETLDSSESNANGKARETVGSHDAHLDSIVQIRTTSEPNEKNVKRNRRLPAQIGIIWPRVGQQVRGPEVSVRVEHRNLNPRTNSSHRGARMCVSLLSGASQDMIGCVLLNVQDDTEVGTSDLRLKNIAPGSYQISVSLVSPARKLTRTSIPFEVLAGEMSTPPVQSEVADRQAMSDTQEAARLESAKASASAQLSKLVDPQTGQQQPFSQAGATCTTTCSTTCG